MLRRFGAFLPMLLGVTAVGVGPILEVPVAFTLLYLIGLACLATACWLVTRFRIWQLAVVVNAIAGFLSAGVWLHWGLQAAIPIRALTALTWGGVCFFLAALISGMKGGLAKHARVWFCRERRAILNEWRE